MSAPELPELPELSWTAAGTGPVLVHLPGAGSALAAADRLAVAVGADARVVTVDASALPAGTADGYPAAVERMLDRLGPAHLVGFGPAAPPAVEVALRRPDLVRSLALVDAELDPAALDRPRLAGLAVSTLVLSGEGTEGAVERELVAAIPDAVRVCVEHAARPAFRTAPESVGSWVLAHLVIVEGLA